MIRIIYVCLIFVFSASILEAYRNWRPIRNRPPKPARQYNFNHYGIPTPPGGGGYWNLRISNEFYAVEKRPLLYGTIKGSNTNHGTHSTLSIGQVLDGRWTIVGARVSTERGRTSISVPSLGIYRSHGQRSENTDNVVLMVFSDGSWRTTVRHSQWESPALGFRDRTQHRYYGTGSFDPSVLDGSTHKMTLQVTGYQGRHSGRSYIQYLAVDDANYFAPPPPNLSLSVD